jgi:hypothetical protein
MSQVREYSGAKLAFLIIWGLGLEIASIVVVRQAAKAKFRDPLLWTGATLLFGFLALAMIAVAPALSAEDAEGRERAVRRYPAGVRSTDGAAL